MFGSLSCILQHKYKSHSICELKNRRLETITNLLIKTRVNLEKEVEERRFYRNTNTLTHKCCHNNKQTNPFGRLTL